MMPPSVNKSNAKHDNAGAVTEYYEFAGRSHWTCAEAGWEEVADQALDWAAGGGAAAGHRVKLRAFAGSRTLAEWSRPRRSAGLSSG
jgi:hypothetical protein